MHFALLPDSCKKSICLLFLDSTEKNRHSYLAQLHPLRWVVFLFFGVSGYSTIFTIFCDFQLLWKSFYSGKLNKEFLCDVCLILKTGKFTKKLYMLFLILKTGKFTKKLYMLFLILKSSASIYLSQEWQVLVNFAQWRLLVVIINGRFGKKKYCLLNRIPVKIHPSKTIPLVLNLNVQTVWLSSVQKLFRLSGIKESGFQACSTSSSSRAKCWVVASKNRNEEKFSGLRKQPSNCLDLLLVVSSSICFLIV